MTERGRILTQAKELTEAARDRVYGDPAVNLQCAAELKSICRRYAAGRHSPAHDEAMEMLLTKTARIATGKPHEDNYVDGAAYIAIAGEQLSRGDGVPPRPPCSPPDLFCRDAATALNGKVKTVKRGDDSLELSFKGKILAAFNDMLERKRGRNPNSTPAPENGEDR